MATAIDGRFVVHRSPIGRHPLVLLERKRSNLNRNLEAPPGFEPGMEVLQIQRGCESCCLVLVSGLSSSPVLPRVRALLDYVRTTAAGDCCTPRPVFDAPVDVTTQTPLAGARAVTRIWGVPPLRDTLLAPVVRQRGHLRPRRRSLDVPPRQVIASMPLSRKKATIIVEHAPIAEARRARPAQQSADRTAACRKRVRH